jgi:hypothetical protein
MARLFWECGSVPWQSSPPRRLERCAYGCFPETLAGTTLALDGGVDGEGEDVEHGGDGAEVEARGPDALEHGVGEEDVAERDAEGGLHIAEDGARGVEAEGAAAGGEGALNGRREGVVDV